MWIVAAACHHQPPPPAHPFRDAAAVEACRAAFPGGADPGFEAGCRAVVTGAPLPEHPFPDRDQPGARPLATPEVAAAACVPSTWLSREAAACVARSAGLPAPIVPWRDDGLRLAPWQNAPIYVFTVLTHTDGRSCSGETAQIDALDGTVRSRGRVSVSHCDPAGLPRR